MTILAVGLTYFPISRSLVPSSLLILELTFPVNFVLATQTKINLHVIFTGVTFNVYAIQKHLTLDF